MLTFCLAYFTLSAIVLLIYSVFSTVDLAALKPALGRRIVLILLLPSVFAFGLAMELQMAIEGANTWAAFKHSLGNFWSETKEIWNGRGDVDASLHD